MAWLKKNLVVVVLIVTVACCVGALVLETANHKGLISSLLSPAPEQTGTAATQSPAGEGTEFQNSDAKLPELVDSWLGDQRLNRYDLALTLDPKNKKMDGTLRFTYVNTESGPMSELHFLLYANCFKRAEYGIFAQDEMDQAYPNGFSPGSIDVSSVECAGEKVNWVVDGMENQVLRVALPQAVAVGGTAEVTIRYSVTIPNCYGRFGYGEDTMSLVNCNPILSVYDGGKWYDYPYYAVGDPFYSETADYQATITAPSGWTIAASGLLSEKKEGGSRVWTVDGTGRRDFGFVASDKFSVMEKTVDGVLVRSYYVQGNKAGGAEALDTGAEAIQLYDKTFGQYPYNEFSVVEADFYIGGMEYPGMVMIDESLYGTPGDKSQPDKVMLDLVVSHETSHQWWYSTIGDDEVMEPWLDEGMAEFSTQYFFEKERSAAFNSYYAQYNSYLDGIRKAQSAGYTPTLPVFRYPDNLTYSAWVYVRTSAILQDLRKKVGDEAFFSALRGYYSEHRLGITTRADLEKAFQKASGTDLSQWFEREFNNSGN